MKTRNLLVSVLMFVSVLLSACAPAATPSPVPTAIPPTAITQTESLADQTTFHSPENASFHLPLTLVLGPEWEAHVGVNTIDIVYDNQWGVGISLVSGALVHDPASIVSDQPASANKADFIPWPADFFAYIASLQGVKIIQEPDPVTIGGVQGSQIIFHTPAMHPILWLKDDYNWLGGGSSGVDPELKYLMILLEVNGEQVLLTFVDAPENFDGHYRLVQEIFNSITFGK